MYMLDDKDRKIYLLIIIYYIIFYMFLEGRMGWCWASSSYWGRGGYGDRYGVMVYYIKRLLFLSFYSFR